MNNEWLARLKEKIGKKENKEELPVRKKLLLLFLTGLGGECKSDDHAEVFGRKCGRKRSAE